MHLSSYSHQVFTTDIPHLWPLRQPMFVLHPAIYIALSLLTSSYTPPYPPHLPMYTSTNNRQSHTIKQDIY